MGKKAKEIVGENVNKIIEELNKALADEWLAYLQYWNAAKIIRGKIANVATKELENIAKDELEHATELTERIIQLGGKPIVDPKEYYTKTNCGYEIPSEDVRKALEAGIKGERCAIDVYKKIANIVKGKDEITYQLALHIMNEEIGHEQKFENLLDEI
ncbi:MAG: ferritin-like domain-containing protein [Candidatus Anstonellales archaeon]